MRRTHLTMALGTVALALGLALFAPMMTGASANDASPAGSTTGTIASGQSAFDIVADEADPNRALIGVQFMAPDSSFAPLIDGTPGVLIIASTTCPHCHTSLTQLAEVSGGDLPRLTVLTLQGAEAGVHMVESLGVRAPVRGTWGDPMPLLRSLQVNGTPTFLAYDENGVIFDRHVGPIGPSGMPTWLPRMR